MGLDSFKSDNPRGYNYAINFTDDMKDSTHELGYIIGVILGDGSVYHNGGKRISLCTKDKEFAEEFGKKFCKWASISWNGWNSEDTEMTCVGPIDQQGESEDLWSCEKSISPVYAFLKQYQDGDYSVNSILSDNNGYKVGVLRGLWDSEGHISKNLKKVGFSNSEERIRKLYMKLVSDLIGVEYQRDYVWASDAMSGKRYGEFEVSDTISETNQTRNIRIPKLYTERFYNVVDPTIERKRALFDKHMSESL